MSGKSEMFFQYLKNKKIACIGMGVSNFATIQMLLEKDADVTVLDRSSMEQLGENAETLRKAGAKFICGDDYLTHLRTFDIVLRSPGVYFNRPEIQDAIRYGTVITSEMELFFSLCPCKIIAVTGSDGKTTTTTLISEMLKAKGYTVHLGGNIGAPLLPQVEDVLITDVAVVELSSFQLLSMRQSPDVGVITNIAPNHLDVHGTMEEYISAKQNLLLHQTGFGRAVLNLDNELSNQQEPIARGMVEKFSRRQKVDNGAYFDEGDQNLYLARHGQSELVMSRSDIKIPGLHNVENYLAAISAVHDMVDFSTMRKVAGSFAGVPHRIELVRELDGVKWYNDSIATSPTRTIAGLNSFDQKIIVLAGGYDKKIPYEPLAPKLVEKVKTLILMGKTAPKIEAALKACPDYRGDNPTIYHVESMEQAVQKAREIAKEGDIVSLSPASASFDLYKNFEVRGDHFKSLVHAL